MKNPRETRRLSRATLLDLVWEAPLKVAAEEVGLSPNGLSKLCDRLLVPRPQRSYWQLPVEERAAVKPALPPTPDDMQDRVELGVGAAPRRSRTRLPLEDRRIQLMDAAAGIVLDEGVQEVTIKRLARDVGISEAQAHNCFARRVDLLTAMARREIAEVEASRRGVVARGTNLTANIVLSTITYLHEAQARGPLLQALLMVPEVRDALRSERRALASTARRPIIESMTSRYGITPAQAFGSNAILTAVCLRAGGLLSSGKTSLAVAERLCLPIMLAGSQASAQLGAQDI